MMNLRDVWKGHSSNIKLFSHVLVSELCLENSGIDSEFSRHNHFNLAIIVQCKLW